MLRNNNEKQDAAATTRPKIASANAPPPPPSQRRRGRQPPRPAPGLERHCASHLLLEQEADVQGAARERCPGVLCPLGSEKNFCNVCLQCKSQRFSFFPRPPQSGLQAATWTTKASKGKWLCAQASIQVDFRLPCGGLKKGGLALQTGKALQPLLQVRTSCQRGMGCPRCEKRTPARPLTCPSTHPGARLGHHPFRPCSILCGRRHGPRGGSH